MWRVVESQFVVSTRKLVDSDAEQEMLERLIDGAKPPVPKGVSKLGLHYLLSTPFRHPPLRNGSRFGSNLDPGIFYGSIEVPTALAEVAYYRFVFLAGTAAELGLVATEHTAFEASVRTSRGVDLSKRPFSEFAAVIASPTEYAATQVMGREMRADCVEVALFTSARDPEKGLNVALFVPAFAAKSPGRNMQAWTCHATKGRVEFRRKSLLGAPEKRGFERGVFEIGGVLPVPAV